MPRYRVAHGGEHHVIADSHRRDVQNGQIRIGVKSLPNFNVVAVVAKERPGDLSQLIHIRQQRFQQLFAHLLLRRQGMVKVET